VNTVAHSVTKPLSKLKRGEGGIVEEVGKSASALQFMEMGILPGESIMVDRIAPLGDPISMLVNSNVISLRRKDAAMIIVRLVDKS
jgi:ferrous iron transport protein A